MNHLPPLGKVGVPLCAFALAFTVLSCGQYEFTSPSPGIVELRLSVKNSRTDLLPFASTSKFNIVVRDIFLTRDDGASLEILQDLQAIRRSPDGDSLNCLSLAARDSQLVIGKSYAPPGTYVGLRRTTSITHDPFVTIYTVAQIPNLIPVLNTDFDKFFKITGSSPQIVVKENRHTIVTLTLDLDSSLVRRTSWFDWPAPYAFISSVQTL